jgi:hypothetical protein
MDSHGHTFKDEHFINNRLKSEYLGCQITLAFNFISIEKQLKHNLAFFA